MLFKLGWAGYAALGYSIRAADLAVQKYDKLRGNTDPTPNKLLADPPVITEINWFQYDDGSQQWQSRSSNSQSTKSTTTTLKIATLNVLHTGQWACDVVSCTPDRWKYQLDVILPGLDADVLCLNEVSEPFLKLLLERSWIRKDYVLSHVTAAHCTPRGNLVICKPQFAHKVHVTYRSKMNVREAIIAEVNMANGAKLFIAAVHLRAYEQYRESRDVEFTQLCKAIEQHKTLEDGVVILGDFNLHAKEEGQIIRAPYVDLWSEIYPNEEGYTFDYRVNKLIPYLFPPERRQMRLDRITLNSANGRFAAKGIEMFANEAIPGVEGAPYLFASDHFGLHTTIQTATPSS